MCCYSNPRSVMPCDYKLTTEANITYVVVILVSQVSKQVAKCIFSSAGHAKVSDSLVVANLLHLQKLLFPNVGSERIQSY